MPRKFLTFLSLAALCLSGALLALYLRQPHGASQPAAPAAAPAPVHTTALRTPVVSPMVLLSVGVVSNAAVQVKRDKFAHRLHNTPLTADQLARKESGLILANALIDTTWPLDLAIPDSLRAPVDNGTYVVQARGPMDDRFRAQLQAAGATPIFYVPNNAFVARVSMAGAQKLRAQGLFVLPYEPYFKIEAGLLPLALGQASPASLPTVRLLVFPDAAQAAKAALQQLGVTIMGEERSPFGPVYTVQPDKAEQVAALARLSMAQALEAAHTRQPANDLTRVRLGAALNPVTNATWLGLSGTNVVVAIDDFAVDFLHPDLVGRMSGDFPHVDTLGHGTHVTGTILGSGAASATVALALGSVTNANFRGLAPAARGLFLSLTSESDPDLQEKGALGGARVSNNSWNYTGVAAYDLSAASFDAAVRDAVPGLTGPQPMLYVFAAGNGGNGDPGGVNGNPQSIWSPATAKNVLTVGALEQDREVNSNLVVGTFTNQPYLVQTDSSNEVAAFSSRGNVGIGIEGDSGRFKPDVVAPGVFVISDRSRQWDTNSYYNPTNFHDDVFALTTIATNTLKPFSVLIPDNAVGLVIRISPNLNSPFPLPDLPIYARFADNPTFTTFDLKGTNTLSLPPAYDINLLRGTTLFYSVGNTWTQTVNVDITATLSTTNDSPELQTLAQVNAGLAPWYRYESGTSMAAAAVTGWLALLQEFFEQRLHQTNSPALMKALLINGSRPVNSSLYDLSVHNPINQQGWGLPQLGNSLPGSLTNLITNPNSTNVSLRYYDQSVTNALATGQRQTRTVGLSGGGRRQPLRMTLVWTDPPGNPVAGIKLVNDLDLVVTNLDTGAVFWGNDIPVGGNFNQASDTNAPAPADFVNNVENVYLSGSAETPLGTNYSVTVLGRRVNVNAVTGNTNNVVQDYALVISSGDGDTLTNALSVNVPSPIVSSNQVTGLRVLPEGLPLFGQRVGGNAPYSGTTNGYTNQWNFYVYTNTTTNLNVAFVTFFPPELGVPRMGTRETASPGNATRVEADVDLYVSGNPALTNLDPAVMALADRSVTRTGTEKVLYTNSAQGQVYYVAVRSQDQEGAEYAFVGVASPFQFGLRDPNGNILLTVLGSFPVPIPDGSPSLPGYTTILALTTEPDAARKVVVSDTVTHQNFGDTIGTLSHGQPQVVLHNHTPFDNGLGSETLVYDDSGEGTLPNARQSDGPGSLRNFVGDRAADGVWILTVVDDAISHTGTVDALSITVEPEPVTNGVVLTLAGRASYFDYVDVPEAATNLTISVGITGGVGPVQLYVRRGAFPTHTVYDKFAVITVPGGAVTISKYESPPLNPGRYYIEVFNPTTNPVQVNVGKTLGLDLTGDKPVNFLSSGDELLPDDAVMTSTIPVGLVSKVVQAEVGVRIDHPRISDLVLTLISPAGTRVLLAENRGGLSTNGYGSGVNTTNFFPAQTAGGPLADTQIIPAGLNQGTLVIDYDFVSIPDDMRVYYDGVRIFDTGLVGGAGKFTVDFGPGSATDVVVVMNEGNNLDTNTSWIYTATVITKGITYATFSEDTNFAKVPIKFANPPFGTNTGGSPLTTVVASSFEGLPTGSNAFPAIVDGWQVLDTNTVQIVAVPLLADTGTNVLALHHGSIGQLLPTVAGRKYTLKFVNHGRPAMVPMSWWKGDGNYIDVAGGRDGITPVTPVIGNGEVKQAFVFDGSGNSVVQVPNSAALNFGPNSPLSVEIWAYRTGAGPVQHFIGKRVACNVFAFNYQMAFDHTGLAFSGSLPPFPGQGVYATHVDMPMNYWTHLAGTFDGTTFKLDLNGFTIGTAVGSLGPTNSQNLTIGASQDCLPFVGTIDEVSMYNRALSQLEIQDIYAAGSAGKCPVAGSCQVSSQVILAGVSTNTIFGVDAWHTNSYSFTAPSNGMTLMIQSVEDGMLFDSFTLLELPKPNPPVYYLPEESLSKVIGENSAGEWKLEVLDNRAGAANPPPKLVSWQLSLTLETTVPFAIPLVHAVPVTNSVNPNGLRFFVVDVPAWAGFATNLLSNASGLLNLLFNQTALPGTNVTDVTLINNSTNGNATLRTNGLPPLLQPGQRYFLGVQNLGTVPVTFTLEVDFNLTTLSNAVPLTNTLAAVGQPRYYQFDVSTNAVAAAFEILAADGNVDLVVSRAPTLPTLSQHDYVSANPGSNSEAIVIRTNSNPVPLSAGRWYVGVFNQDTNAVNYIIRATETGPPTIIVLSNGIPMNYQSGPGVALTNFFQFTVDQTNAAVLFELYNLNGNVDLLVQRDSLPFGPSYLAGSFNLGTNGEQIVLRTNLLGTNINANWFLAVPNNELTNVSYTIRAVVSTNGVLVSGIPPTPVVVVPAPGSPTGPTLTWPTVPGEKYRIEVSTNLVTWTVLATVTATGPTLIFVDPNPMVIPGFRFYRIVQVP